MDAPLDFEFEDPLLNSPVIVKKSKKVIGLDDLLTDHYQEKSKVIERESKRAKAKKKYDSDEDDFDKEALLSKQINECHNQMQEMSGEAEIATWGVHVFGTQKPLPVLTLPELGSCSLLRSFMSSELNSLVELTTEKVETFLEGLLVNGWLSKLVNTCSYMEKSIAKWTFYLMLYSSKEKLRASACDFWCNILFPRVKTEKLPIRIEWFPSYCELRSALETYGFLFNYLSRTESIINNSGVRGPPKNIRAWIKFVAACCCVRNKRPVFSTSEAEELVEVAVFLSSDRQLEGLLVLLDEFVQSVISYFTDEEWNISCEKIARSISCRSPRDLNCLQTVECISGVSTRGNHLRSAISYQILLNCFDNKASNEEEILSFLISINVKDRSCDLFQMYIYLVLTENWLLSNPMFELKPVIYEMWGVYLRNCSCQITSTDMRPYASKGSLKFEPAVQVLSIQNTISF
ncbi:PREDICTED: uncharacterized protein LOC105131168 isoform X4 [Populus euphratica]|uniref:Uncharacterized protein LOC105131168 isoform X4 n=1 Tax=Populus euphratica TaxID=75702 RepID=A0AAJ6UM77_POPEU|nr:PREDICTED: uncharacterized protein LOC105131168 isoform X4 [Populus euphratica]